MDYIRIICWRGRTMEKNLTAEKLIKSILLKITVKKVRCKKKEVHEDFDKDRKLSDEQHSVRKTQGNGHIHYNRNNGKHIRIQRNNSDE